MYRIKTGYGSHSCWIVAGFYHHLLASSLLQPWNSHRRHPQGAEVVYRCGQAVIWIRILWPLIVQGDKVFMKVVYPNSSSTEIRSRLRLRSTVRGANNRLDLLSIVSYDHADGRAVPLAGICYAPPSLLQPLHKMTLRTNIFWCTEW